MQTYFQGIWVIHKTVGLWEAMGSLGDSYNCKRGRRQQIHCFDPEVSYSLAVGQERSSNHCHVEKEEVVQALQEVAVRSPLHLSQPEDVLCLMVA